MAQDKKDTPLFDLPRDFEEEIRLPKFVEQVPEKKEPSKVQFGAPKKYKIKKYLPIIIIVVVLVVIYGGYLFLKSKNIIFTKKETKETPAEIKKTPEANFNEIDEDGDGLINLEELKYGTNTKEKDTDFDGMLDGWEVKFKLNPLDYSDALSDPDEDALTNLEEYQYNTDPTKKDTDGDGYSDGKEVEHGYNPAGTGKLAPR